MNLEKVVFGFFTLLALTLKGLARLGEAVRAGAFTIGRISADKAIS